APAAIRLDDGSGLVLRNALVQGLLYGLDVDGAASCAQLGAAIDVSVTLVAGVAGDPDSDPDCAAQGGAAAEANFLAQPSRANQSVAAPGAAQMLASPFDASLPDFRPVSGGVAASATSPPSDGFFALAPWYGASEPRAGGGAIPWYSGWTLP